MKKLLTLFSIILISKFTFSQDISVTAITQPVSGCALTSTENVTIRMFNFGPTLLAGSSFNVSYTINAGAPVTELLTLGSNVLTNSTFNYTFTTQANLSVPGTYTIDATCALAGDVNPTNDAFTGYSVTNTAASVGGTVSGGTNVCIGINSGNLTLAGNTGNVINWEYSVDGGGTWISISNTTTTQSYTNLTVPTRYRAKVQNGSCAIATSSVAIMTIDPLSVGGSVSGGTTVCSGTNAGTLTSTGKVGTILKWQYSLDAGVTWIDTAHVANSITYSNLTATRRYRVQVQSGVCSSTFSVPAVITVNPASVGGTITGGTSVCSGTNSGTLTLSGHTGTITRWEFSINAGATWTNIVNSATTQTYTNLTQTRYFRAFIISSGCIGTYSTIDSIVVSSPTVAGTVTSNTTVCASGNAGTLTLAGNTGTINNWSFSTDGGTTFTNIVNTTTTQNYLNLTTTTIYRATVQNGSCASANSATATITVNPISVGGTTASNDTVCSGSNNGTITLAGNTGTVTNWLSSTDGITWNNIVNTTTSQTFNNIAATTYYQAVVKSGVCASDSSSIDTITVDVPSVGGTVSTSANICFGTNAGTLTLAGHTGNVVRWESSIDGGINFSPIANTTTTHNYANLTLTTIFRAVVQNGTCSTANSSTATLTVDPVSVGGTLNGSTTACGGSNSGTLTLINYVGTIQGWISSTDAGATWTPIANTTATFNYTNVASTTQFAVIVASGVCTNDTSSIAIIAVDPPSVGGTLSVDATVCASSNFGTLTLAGQTGTIQNWQSSTDGGVTWLTIANTSSSQIYSNLTTTTSYKVEVKSGVCNAATSNAVTITVDPIAVGGTINGGTTICGTTNNGTLTLAGSVGTVVNWESSTDAGATWTTIANTTTTENYTNLTDTTWYRAIVTSGLCGNDTSSTAVVYIDPTTVAGTLSVSDTVCSGLNGGTIHLTGYTGAIQGWEMSLDGGFNWIPLTNMTDSLVYNNLTMSTSYRVNVKSGICSALTSNTVTITVDPVPVGGTLNSTTLVCDTINNGTLTLTGSAGSIVNWETSTDAGATWNTLANTTTSYTYNNLTDTTWFRVIVGGGSCGNDTSSVAIIYINPATNAGVLSSNDTVCASANAGTLHLTGYVGTIQGWEMSIDGGFNFLPLTNTTDSLVYNNLTITTIYRAIVKSGICNAAYSNADTITVDAVSNAGTISGAMPGCEGTNAGTLTVAGYAGTIQNWENSTDGITWTGLTNTTATQTYANLVDTTGYRVIVQNGVCPADTSATASVIVYPKPVANFTADTVCLNNTTTFTNTSTITGGFIQFNQWAFGDNNTSMSTNPTNLYTTAGTFTATLITTSNFSCMDTATVFVIVNALPPNTVSASGPLEFCAGDTLVLSAAIGGYDYLWNTADTTNSINVLTSGNYDVTLTDTLTGCTNASDIIAVTVFPTPVVFAGNDTTLSLGGSISINALGAGVVSWSWFPNTGLNSASIPNPLASPIVTTTYQLIGTDVNGCTDTDSLTLTVIADYNVTVSNLMTPNGDGYNDRWIVQNLENYPNTQVMVVNREGQVIFESSNYDNNWDGTNKFGKPLNDGTYYYVIQFDGSDKIYKGSITIIRDTDRGNQ